jgi:hypothetical protein
MSLFGMEKDPFLFDSAIFTLENSIVISRILTWNPFNIRGKDSLNPLIFSGTWVIQKQ